MEITYLGHSSFKLKGKTSTLITDPFDPDMVGLKFPKLEADLVTISHHHADHDKLDQVSVSKMVIDGPGEYEISGVSIIGIKTYHDSKKGEERGKNTIFVIEIDGVRVCHLGDLGHTLSEGQLSEIGQIDVLMIPVGGEFTIGPEEAAKVTHSIEPGMILPMHYKVAGLASTFDKLQPLDEYIKQMGNNSQTLPKINVKQGEILPGEEKIIILDRKP